jgi:release factor glutamine methyltransferase
MALNVRELLQQGRLDPPDAQILLAHALRRDRAWLIAHATDAVAQDDVERYLALAAARRQGMPVAYLTGNREFWGLALTVTPSVLIPRPETEALVELALSKLPADRGLRVLDLGTGSGALALAIAKERPRARVLATDRSVAALDVARANAARLRLSNVMFVASDWYDDLPIDASDACDACDAFDLILSNPPYVRAGDPHLSQGDVRFEPIDALRAGADGLDALRSVIAGAPRWLAAGGWIAVEHGHDQADAVSALMRVAQLTEIDAARDLSGILRVAAGRIARFATMPIP